ncbi:RNA polymerase sigma factor [Ruania alba]|uniref:RNA polymerase sigma-70 factor, ECF subfamily n=1 Tax=Ruania alba TaxID=648782 RepID=A0A1H5G0U2_9MICO|nr:RNA polymerase sigma factor [Ruania alba]SEE09309.1 RNA polymerase sigma-70 factor, ECF subfamily [Ruania alba]
MDDIRSIGTDPDAFERFYRTHVRAIEGFVARRVRDPHKAADLTADIFLAAIESASSYRDNRGSPIGWLYGIARNVIARDARNTARELKAVSRVSGRALLDADSMARVEERLDAELGARQIYIGLARVSEAERAVLELVALDGLTVSDAAHVLGIQPVTARVRLHRARRALKVNLARAVDIGHSQVEVTQ